MILNKEIGYLKRNGLQIPTELKKAPICGLNMELGADPYVHLNDLAMENAFAYFYSIDLQKNNYLFLSKSVQNVLGFNQDFLMKQGPVFVNDCIHPDDRSKLKVIQKKMLEYFFTVPLSERKSLKFEYNFRMKRYDGTYIQLLQQISFIEISIKGDPLITYNTCTDISSYKHGNTIKLSVYKLENKCRSRLFEQDFYDCDLQLTRRQKEVIELISQGLTSTQIGSRLNISVDTVKNHRKKILLGTNAKNMVEAIKMVCGQQV